MNYPCAGTRYATQIEARIAATSEAIRMTGAHFTPVHLDTYVCVDGHFHVGGGR